MKATQKLLAVLMAVIMLAGMLPMPVAEAECKHVWGPKHYGDGQATCIDPISWWQECTKCGNARDGEEYGPHKWGSWNTTQDASCIQEGKRERTCKVCGKVETQKINKTGHKYGDWYRRGIPTCTEAGLEAHECIVCGYGQTVELPALGHDWSGWYVVRQPSASQKGLEERICNRCGITEQREFDGTPEGTEDVAKSISLTLSSIGTVQPDGTVNVTLTAQNTGAARLLYTGIYDSGSHAALLAGNVNTSLRAGESTQATITLTPTAAEIAAGMITRSVYTEGLVECNQDDGSPITESNFHGAGMYYNGRTYSNAVSFSIELPVTMSITKTVTSTPKNGTFYVPGEEIHYTMTATNSGMNATSVRIFDPMFNDGLALAHADVLAQGQSLVASGTYVVTEADAQKGYVSNTAGVYWFASAGGIEQRVSSNTVTVTAGLPDAMSITKAVTSTPRNGTYYTPGEEIHYSFTAQCDYGTAYKVAIIDELFGSGAILALADMVSAGGTLSASASYTVTEADAQRGYVENVAFVGWYATESGNDSSGKGVYSNKVIVPCGIPASSLVLEVYIKNAPADGVSFKSGEYVDFEGKLTNNGPEAVPYTYIDVALSSASSSWGYNNFVSDYPLDAGASTTVGHQHMITDQDVTGSGTITFTVTARGKDQYGNALPDITQSLTIFPEKYNEDPILTTALTNAPANGSFFVPGETMQFTISYENPTKMDMKSLNIDGHVHNQAFSGGDGALAKVDLVMGADFPAAASGTASLSYTVTYEDAVRGFVNHYARLFAESDEEWCERQYLEYSNDVTVPTGLGDPQLIVTHTLLNSPLDGIAFQEGEVVRLGTSVTNYTGVDLPVVNPYTIFAAAPMVPIAVPSGATVSATDVYYTITATDVAVGSVYSDAFATGTDAQGNTYTGYSNGVIVPTSGGIFGVITDLTVTKAVVSAPKNGVHYTEGEVVTYVISYTNTGETQLIDVVIYDALKPGEVAHAEKLEPSESRSCAFSHTVTAADVQQGYISNTALASYSVSDYGFSASSNTVVVDTDGKADDPAYVGTIDTTALRAAEDYCSRTITGRDNASVTYETDFCAAHTAIQAAVLKMSQSIASPELKIQAATYAVNLWRAEVEKLNQALFEAADSAGKATVMTEYIRFLTEIANYEAMLKLLYPKDATTVALKIAAMWEDKCITMCNEAHADAAERKDSLLSVTAGTAAVQAACTCETTGEEQGKKTCAQGYCELHSFPFSMVDTLLQGKDTAEGWTTLRHIWMVELNKAYTQLADKLGDKAPLAMAECIVFTQWTEAREAALTALYPDNPELVAQSMTKLIMERVNSLCQLVK